jgi:glycosyltransferase involved in cell wall biosynthesis
MPENGIDDSVFPIASAWPAPVDGRYRFVTTGRLVPAKSFDLLIEAFAGSDALDHAELHIIGEGVERQALEAQIDRLGVGDRVRLRGWLTQPEIAATYASSQAFAFASVKEFGGGVILEAMASALPCVVIGYGGPGDLVDPDVGIVVPMARRAELVRTMRAAMERLAGDPDLSRHLGETAARRVAEEHTWTVKADRLVAFYREVLAQPPPSRGRTRRPRTASGA